MATQAVEEVLVSLLVRVGAPVGHRVMTCCAPRDGFLLYLPPYLPDLNPIELAFAKLKALLRKAAADHAPRAIGEIQTLRLPIGNSHLAPISAGFSPGTAPSRVVQH